MAHQVRWHHNEEQGKSERDHHNEIRIEGDKGTDSEKRKSVGWCSPCQETLKPILEDENNTDPAPV